PLMPRKPQCVRVRRRIRARDLLAIWVVGVEGRRRRASYAVGDQARGSQVVEVVVADSAARCGGGHGREERSVTVCVVAVEGPAEMGLVVAQDFAVQVAEGPERGVAS